MTNNEHIFQIILELLYSGGHLKLYGNACDDKSGQILL